MFFKTRKDRSIYNPFGAWKGLFIERLLRNAIFKEIYEKQTVISIVDVLLTLYIEKNIPVIEKCIIENNMKALIKFQENIPHDFESVDYATIRVLEVETTSNRYALIVITDEQYRHSKVHRVIDRESKVNLKSFFESYTIVFP